MKRSHQFIFFFVILASVIFGCKNDDTDTVVFPYANIVSYNIPGQIGSAVIDKAARTISITMPFGSGLERVMPTFAISSNATVVPAYGEVVNFKTNHKVTYVVTSESGKSSEWTVEVTLTADPEAIQLELIPNTGGWNAEFTVYHDLSYNKYLTRSSGWNGGDGCVSTELPDGSLLWSFQDSFFGLVDNNRSRSSDLNTFARNAGFIQKNKSLLSYVQLNPGENKGTDTWVRYPGANDNDDDKWYWGGPSQVINGEVQMLMGQIQPADFAGVHISTDVAIFDTEMNFKELIQDKYVGELAWDGSIFKADDGYTYMYTQKNYGICAAKIYVARVPDQDLRGTWEYYTTDGWVSTAPTDINKYIAVLDGTATQANVFKKGDKYYFVTQGTCFGLEILIYESDSPTGPFTNQRKLYTIPDKYTQDATPKFITYNAVVHPALSKEGELVISYNINPVNFGDNFNAPGTADNYRPYFVRVYNWESN